MRALNLNISGVARTVRSQSVEYGSAGAPPVAFLGLRP